ncbi:MULTISPECIES: hypothetical protein [Rhizobium]|uniref:Uncharacterized protein n=1 Tax=Rhizobium phaseoli TaxID=396 RepID=A0A7X6F5R9_9HYPH|nr:MULTISPECIES: hypothetical protein [Rhizobium]MDE8761885.1 hypothetical protein [Rhizobium sp. CBK13]NKF13442.1 hypothetical protein [Rhizobium phaseoli]QPK07721.1 hypothetical protein HER27_014760 [Rhizobium phaseoli]
MSAFFSNAFVIAYFALVIALLVASGKCRSISFGDGDGDGDGGGGWCDAAGDGGGDGGGGD